MLAGEWSAIKIFLNDKGTLIDITEHSGLATFKGWWNSIIGIDYDLDGDMDYLAGNLGHNHHYQNQYGDAVKVYADDFDNNGSIDALMTRINNQKEVLVAPRDVLINQMQVMKKIYPRFEQYAHADISEVLRYFNPDSMMILEANYFSTSLIENLGNGKFRMKALPEEMQMSPVFGSSYQGIDELYQHTILSIGNLYHTEVLGGRYDAGIGHTLKIDTMSNMRYISPMHSGFWVPGDAKSLVQLRREKDVLYLATRNDQRLKVYSYEDESKQLLIGQNDVSAFLTYSNGQTQKIEWYYGQGYLSQSSRKMRVPPGVISIKLCSYEGKCREIPHSLD